MRTVTVAAAVVAAEVEVEAATMIAGVVAAVSCFVYFLYMCCHY